LEIFGRPLNDVLFSREFRESLNYSAQHMGHKFPRGCSLYVLLERYVYTWQSSLEG
jgi:hypothetical protein